MAGAAASPNPEDGWDAVTHLSVAAASGVGRATVYRHWPSRTDLLRDVIRREAEMSHTTPVADLRRDLRRELEALGRQLGAPALAAVVAVLFERSLHDPTLADVKAAVVHEVSRVVREILHRGVETGNLPPSLNETAPSPGSSDRCSTGAWPPTGPSPEPSSPTSSTPSSPPPHRSRLRATASGPAGPARLTSLRGAAVASGGEEQRWRS